MSDDNRVRYEVSLAKRRICTCGKPQDECDANFREWLKGYEERLRK